MAATQTITVRDTTPPTVDPDNHQASCFWPPDHAYICLALSDLVPSVHDSCSTATFIVTGCLSDQPDDAPDPDWPGWNGDGNTTQDCVVISDKLCALSERCGTGPAAQDGRRYGIVGFARDACGNQTASMVVNRVHVPHDQSPHEGPCLDPARVGCHPNEPLPDCARR